MPEINESYDWSFASMDISQKARLLAIKFHEGQKRWNGTPYITHPEAVAEIVRKKLAHLDKYTLQLYVAIAFLHDVWEDTNISVTDLDANGIPSLVKEVSLILTKDHNESYLDYILRVKKNGVAKIVKLADIEHNLSTSDPKRNKGIRDKWMLAKYILEN